MLTNMTHIGLLELAKCVIELICYVNLMGDLETPSVAKAGWPPVPRAVTRPDDVLTALRRVAIGAIEAATDELQYLGGTLVLL